MITNQQAIEAVALMSICRYFPSSDVQFAQIAAILVQLVDRKDELDWLVREQSKLDWKGPQELRVLFSSRFQPRESAGIDPERAYFERESAETAKRIAGWKNEQKLLGQSPITMDDSPVAEVKRMDRTTDDLRFRRVQEFLGKEVKPTYIPATPVRTASERAKLVHNMETALGMDALQRRFGYCAAFDHIPGSDMRFRPNLPVVLA